MVRVATPCQATGTAVTLAIRPERLAIQSPRLGVSGANALEGRIVRQTFCGNVRHYEVDLGQETTFLVETRPSDSEWKIGDAVRVTWHREDAVVVSS
jgi:ABC-type Fe3+/spermidine/putrescine transport system ATPase subunit